MDNNELLDFEMDELLDEFAEEEEKGTVVELGDSDDELDELVEEFATTLSDSEDNETKASAKIVLSSSDDEIDNLLDDFQEDNSTESEPMKQDNSISKENKSFVIFDNNIQNDSVYQSSIEIVSDENNPDDPPVASDLVHSKTNESRTVSSFSAMNSDNYSQMQSEKNIQSVSKDANNSDSTQNCFKENKSSYNHRPNISNVKIEKDSQDTNHQRYFPNSSKCSSSGGQSDTCHKSDVYLPMETLPASQKLKSFVKEFIELNNFEKNPPPLSISNVTVVCDENILKGKGTSNNTISMTKLIERTVEDCLSNKSGSSFTSATDKTTDDESTDTSSSCDINTYTTEDNSTGMLPMITNICGSVNQVEEDSEKNASNSESGYVLFTFLFISIICN